MQRNYIALLTASLVLVALALAGAAAGLGGAVAETPTASDDDRTITVDAVGEAEAEPDQAEVALEVRADGDEPAAVRDDLAAGAADLTDALDRLDVEYETSDFAIDEPPRHIREEQPDIADYLGIHAFHVTVDDPDDVGAVIDAAADAGAEIDGIDLTLSEDARHDLRDEAIENAMSDASHQANAVADAGDLQVTGVHSVDASQQRFRTANIAYAAELDVADDVALETEIETGQVSVTYSVDVVYNATAA